MGRGGTRPYRRLPNLCAGGCAVGANAIFDGDPAQIVFAERRINYSTLIANMAVDEREIFLLDAPSLEEFAQVAGRGGIFCDDDYAAGFAVETIYEMRGGKDAFHRVPILPDFRDAVERVLTVFAWQIQIETHAAN